jgi:hypothetical protein
MAERTLPVAELTPESTTVLQVAVATAHGVAGNAQVVPAANSATRALMILQNVFILSPSRNDAYPIAISMPDLESSIITY